MSYNKIGPESMSYNGDDFDSVEEEDWQVAVSECFCVTFLSWSF
jgi:hypothetical protein